MSNIVLLDSQSHRKLRVHAQPAAHYGDNQRFVAVVVNEFPALAMHYPILFSKDADTGQFYCGAMMGFDAGENLFLERASDPRGVPAAQLAAGTFPHLGVGFGDRPRSSAGGAVRRSTLFTEAGEPSGYLQSIMGLMRELRPGLERTRIFIDTLLNLKLIEPMTISARFDDGTDHEFTGLYTINRDQLKELADAAALDLFRRGYLQLIYLMLASLEHVSALAQRKNHSFLPGGAARGSGLGLIALDEPDAARGRRSGVIQPRAIPEGDRRALPARGHARIGGRLAGGPCSHAVGRGFSGLSGPLRQWRRDRGLRWRAQDRRQVLLRRGSEGVQFRTAAHALCRGVERHRRHPRPKRGTDNVRRFGSGKRVLAGLRGPKRAAGVAAHIAPRIWLGHASNVSAHFDAFDNVACVVAGARRFTLYPPEAIEGLYVGPLDNTMAGQPVSLAASAPADDDKYPLFREIREQALRAELSPGTAFTSPSSGGIRSSPRHRSTAWSTIGGTPLRPVRIRPIPACCSA